jgi:hypothetical protein
LDVITGTAPCTEVGVIGDVQYARFEIRRWSDVCKVFDLIIVNLLSTPKLFIIVLLLAYTFMVN